MDIDGFSCEGYLELKQPDGFANPQRTEKQKMLNGDCYQYVDDELDEDRRKCAVACKRFNKLYSYVNEQERQRLLQQTSVRFNNFDGTTYIEAPFRCVYGYNVLIENGVRIGSECFIEDPCQVIIKSGTIIESNVSIYGNNVTKDPSNREHFGMALTIEENVLVGAGVTFIVDKALCIKKGTVIEAWSIVQATQWFVS